MITEIILNIFYSVAAFILYLLPESQEFPDALNTAMTNIASYYDKANTIFPVDTLFQVIGIALTIEAAILVYKIIDYFWKRRPKTFI